MNNKTPKDPVVKAQNRAAAGDSMRASLASPEGEAWLAKLTDTLAARIDDLVIQDPYCKGILDTITAINVDLQIGRKAAQQLVGQKLRR